MGNSCGVAYCASQFVLWVIALNRKDSVIITAATMRPDSHPFISYFFGQRISAPIPHRERSCFASLFCGVVLGGGCDLRTIQELPGDGDPRTTEIYTRVTKGVDGCGVSSPTYGGLPVGDIIGQPVADLGGFVGGFLGDILGDVFLLQGGLHGFADQCALVHELEGVFEHHGG